MRVLRAKKKWAAAILGVAVIGTLAAVALGSHTSSGFVGEPPLVTANFNETVRLNSDRVKFQTKDATDVRVQKNVFSAGGRSGWHHHPGIVIVAVQSGAVTLTHSDCSSKTYGYRMDGTVLPNGAVFAEGGDEPVEASSATGATVYVTFVAPSADPPVFRIDDHDFPGCP